MTIQEKIQNKKTYLGIEFGSTRIKAVLIDDTFAPVASGSHDWQNRYENGVWTYSLDDITTGLQHCYASLAEDVKSKYGVVPTGYGAMGISGMMHGYMAFNKDDNLLVPFRTWRNTITEPAASELSELLGFNIPQRWSIAHLYQAVLNGEDHVKDIAHIKPSRHKTCRKGYCSRYRTLRSIDNCGKSHNRKRYIRHIVEK